MTMERTPQVLWCRWTMPDNIMQEVNDALCEYFGTRRDQILGHVFVPEIPQEDMRTTREKEVLLSVAQPTALHMHRVLLREEERWTVWHQRGWFDETGGLIGIEATGQDITHWGVERETDLVVQSLLSDHFHAFLAMMGALERESIVDE